MKKTIFILALLTIIGYERANAFELYAGAGYTQTKKPINMLWYQEEFEHDIDNESPSFHIGAKKRLGDFGFRVEAKHLGKYSTYAKASASDHNYIQYREGKEDIWPLSTWKGSGQVYGLATYIQYHLNPVHIYYGVFYHKSEWEVDIPDWRCDASTPKCETDNPIYSDPIARNVKASSGFDTGYSGGVGFEVGEFMIEYEVNKLKSRDKYTAAYKGLAHTIKLSYVF